LALLESDAAGVVAERASDAELQSLAELHQALETAQGDRETFFRINEEFHQRLLQLADNRWREQMVADLRKVMKLNRHQSLLKSGRIVESLKEHRLLLLALQSRDAAASAQRMREHFLSGLEAAN
jgi:DNA-binding FadR family transcriptional regulator